MSLSSDPTPVAVVAPDTIPVEVVGTSGPIPVKVISDPRGKSERRATPQQSQESDPSLPAKTTFQQDLTMAGQRNINLIWETTQARVALFVVLGAMIIDGVAVLLSMTIGRDMTAAQALGLGFVNTTASGVISFYFSRTNHAAIGGVGNKAEAPYAGR